MQCVQLMWKGSLDFSLNSRPHRGVPSLTKVAVAWILAVGLSSAYGQESQVVKKPSADEVKRFAEHLFAQQPGYETGDLITRSGTERLLAQLESKGWTVGGRDQLLQRVLADDSFLVRQLRDDKGRRFLKSIEKLPGGLDRLDRLSQLPQGEMSVRDLIHKIPNGAEWIEAMTTTRRGEVLGDRLSNIEGVGDFNAPTGRIYTLPELVREIHSQLEPTGKASTRQP